MTLNELTDMIKIPRTKEMPLFHFVGYSDIKLVNKLPRKISFFMHMEACPDHKGTLEPGKDVTQERGLCLLYEYFFSSFFFNILSTNFLYF